MMAIGTLSGDMRVIVLANDLDQDFGWIDGRRGLTQGAGILSKVDCNDFKARTIRTGGCRALNDSEEYSDNHEE